MNEKERKAIDTEIRALLDQGYDAARKVDVDRMFAGFSDMLPVGAIDNGVFFPTLEDIKSFFREGFARLKGQDMEAPATRIAILAPTVAIATAHNHFTAHGKDGSAIETVSAMTFIFAKEGDDWKIIHIHQSFPLPR